MWLDTYSGLSSWPLIAKAWWWSLKVWDVGGQPDSSAADVADSAEVVAVSLPCFSSSLRHIVNCNPLPWQHESVWWAKWCALWKLWYRQQWPIDLWATGMQCMWKLLSWQLAKARSSFRQTVHIALLHDDVRLLKCCNCVWFPSNSFSSWVHGDYMRNADNIQIMKCTL